MSEKEKPQHPEKTENREVQSAEDGAGPRFHRTYSVDLPIPFERADRVMQKVKADPNQFSPQLIAKFEKTKGASGRLDVGDEFMVHITGPWNGPVRVSQVTDSSFTLVTLGGHIEAGQIRFSIHKNPDQSTRFEIESVSRSKDRIVDLFYDKLRVAQFAQTEMWQLFCQNFAKAASPDQEPPTVQIRTERQDLENGSWVDVSNQLGAQGLDSVTR